MLKMVLAMAMMSKKDNIVVMRFYASIEMKYFISAIEKCQKKNHQFDNCCYDVRQLFWEKKICDEQ